MQKNTPLSLRRFLFEENASLFRFSRKKLRSTRHICPSSFINGVDRRRQATEKGLSRYLLRNNYLERIYVLLASVSGSTVVIEKRKDKTTMANQLLANIMDVTTEEVSELAIEYAQLSSLPTLTEVQSERLEEILKLACSDGALSFWIGEFDHVLGHELGLLNSEHRQDYDNKKALLKEYLVEFIETAIAEKTPKEVKHFLEWYLNEKGINSIANPLSPHQRPQNRGYQYSAIEPENLYQSEEFQSY